MTINAEVFDGRDHRGDRTKMVRFTSEKGTIYNPIPLRDLELRDGQWWLTRPAIDVEEKCLIRELKARREALRTDRKFTEADKIRDQLVKMGVSLQDSKTNPVQSFDLTEKPNNGAT